MTLHKTQKPAQRSNCQSLFCLLRDLAEVLQAPRLHQGWVPEAHAQPLPSHHRPLSQGQEPGNKTPPWGTPHPKYRERDHQPALRWDSRKHKLLGSHRGLGETQPFHFRCDLHQGAALQRQVLVIPYASLNISIVNSFFTILRSQL